MTPRASYIKHLTVVLVGVAFLAGWAGNYERRAHVSTRVVKVERSWGSPDQSIPGDQVNANLAGATCDWYAKRQTLVCHG